MLNIWVGNLGKYNEGELKGGWLELPKEKEEIDEFLKEVVGLNEEYEEYMINDFETDLPYKVSEYESIKMLNLLAKVSENIYNMEAIEGYANSEGNLSIEQLENTIKYEKDGYIGEYILNPNTLKIKTNYNGFREDLIEETINYTNLEKNDLDFIPKQTIKNGLTLDLLNVEWEVESTKMIGEYEVANTYTAKCYYATKQRVDYPNTYTVTAEYFGTATKTEEHPITYVVKYEKEEPEVVEEKQENNVLPVVGGTTGIILVIVFFLTRNVTVYNYKDGEYKKVGKVRATKAGKIKLDRFSLFETTNKYKLELSKNLTKKLKGKMITVNKNGTTIKMLVNGNEKEKYIVEVRI